MIPKLIIPYHVSLSPQLQAQILYYVAINTPRTIISYDHEGEIIITSKNVMLKHNDDNVTLTCSQEWVQVMYVLNNISFNTIISISKVLEQFSTKFFLTLDVIMMIQHIDIRLTLSRVIFDQMQHGHTYEVRTYVNDGKLLPCYSKYSGYEHDPYLISKHMINYFDQTYNVYEQVSDTLKAREICGPNWLIDPEQQLYLISVSSMYKVIHVGKIEDSKVSVFTYVIDNNYILVNTDIKKMTSKITKYYFTKWTTFRKLVETKIGFVPDHVQIHHNLIGNKLC